MPLETEGLLSPAEFQKFSTFRFAKRRNEWLLGRWAAKALAHSLPAYQQYTLNQIEIHNAPQGAPHIQLPDGMTPEDCLTISHSDASALCALATGPDVRIGADLEKIDARTETFVLDYFTPAECQLVKVYSDETRAVVVTLIWSLKESMLKALGVGLRWDTRAVEVSGLQDSLSENDGMGGWQSIQVAEAKASERVWMGWWQRRDPFILTLAGFAATQAEMQSVRLVEKQIGR